MILEGISQDELLGLLINQEGKNKATSTKRSLEKSTPTYSFPSVQALPTNNVALLKASSNDADLNLITIPGYQNNCLLYSILYSLNLYITDKRLRDSIVRVVTRCNQLTIAELFTEEITSSFRVHISCNNNELLGIDHGLAFIDWLKEQRIVADNLQCGLMEFYSTRINSSANDFIARDGALIEGEQAINIVLWNSGNLHYSVINFSNLDALRCLYNNSHDIVEAATANPMPTREPIICPSAFFDNPDGEQSASPEQSSFHTRVSSSQTRSQH